MIDPATSHRRQVLALLAATTLCRLPVTAFSVLFVVQSAHDFGRYGIGGLATLCYMSGAMGNSAVAGWFLVRWGHLRTVLVATAGCGVAMGLAAVPNHGSAVRLCVLAGLIGLTYPPLHISSRTIYPTLLSPRVLLKVYSWDVSLVQISWIVVPVAVIVLLEPVGAPLLYFALTLMMLAGSAWYVAILRRTGHGAARTPTPSPRTQRPTRDLVLYVQLLAAGLVLFSSGLIMPGLIAVLAADGQRSIAVLVWSIGSAVGSVVVNRGRIVRGRLVGLLCAAMIGVAAALIVLDAGGGPLGAVMPALLLLGFSTAPVTGAVFFLTSQYFAGAAQASIFGWITGVQLVAEGLGAAVSGALLDHGGGTWVAVMVVLALLVLATLIAADPRGTFSGKTRQGVTV